jgi:hypothetical protein
MRPYMALIAIDPGRTAQVLKATGADDKTEDIMFGAWKFVNRSTYE